MTQNADAVREHGRDEAQTLFPLTGQKGTGLPLMDSSALRTRS